MDEITQQLLLAGIRTRKVELQAQLADMERRETQLLDGKVPQLTKGTLLMTAGTQLRRKRREISPETRAKMAEAARLRWAAKSTAKK